MFKLTSRRRSPSTLYPCSSVSRMRWISSSVRSLVRFSVGICAFSQICFAVVRPMPYRYVSEIWICFSRGRSTPAIRAIYRLLIPAAACDGGSRSRSRARRPCGGSPCTSRRSSSPKHGPSRLPPADENAPKITFLPSRTPYRGSHRRGQPGTKGARLITASPQYVKLAPGSAGDPTHDLSASNSRTAFDLDPPARFRAGEGRGPHLHRLRQQARPGIDQRLAWLQQDLGTGADTAVFGTVSRGDSVADQDGAGTTILQHDPDVVLHLGRRGGEARRAHPKRVRRDGFGSQRGLVPVPARPATLKRPSDLDLGARGRLARVHPGGEQRIRLHGLAELTGGLGSGAAAAPRPVRGAEIDRADAAGVLALEGKEEQGLGRLAWPLEQVEMTRCDQGDHGRVRTWGPFSVTAMVCSQWLESFPSRVTTVQPSGNVSTSCVPRLIIGSMGRTIPGRIRGFGCPRDQRESP